VTLGPSSDLDALKVHADRMAVQMDEPIVVVEYRNHPGQFFCMFADIAANDGYQPLYVEEPVSS
jgi:hypothetical protein